MAESLKVLGQVSPVGGELSALYQVPASYACTVSSLTVCNRSSTPGRFRVAVAVADTADDHRQYLYYDHELDGNATFVATIGITLGPTDTIRVQADSALFSFHAYGIEVN
jgi:hypothetical protein